MRRGREGSRGVERGGEGCGVFSRANYRRGREIGCGGCIIFISGLLMGLPQGTREFSDRIQCTEGNINNRGKN